MRASPSCASMAASVNREKSVAKRIDATPRRAQHMKTAIVIAMLVVVFSIYISGLVTGEFGYQKNGAFSGFHAPMVLNLNATSRFRDCEL